ncbi:tubulin-tyrosine ligase family protein [Stylonychia lemnae]|uniref:Tubulin-tyrosine ligase family protein n=1 Tax=Stylonychia lemnae TaxID=5949 RepID=A0A078AKV3_STYLE|nr:tubulin-tyrosine ligase family protein [Stylonychia lemnae]|eukprot:CDW81438.1 tubulin-tyrosine ligase family protein [Stylonychia lemnae]
MGVASSFSDSRNQNEVKQTLSNAGSSKEIFGVRRNSKIPTIQKGVEPKSRQSYINVSNQYQFHEGSYETYKTSFQIDHINKLNQKTIDANHEHENDSPGTNNKSLSQNTKHNFLNNQSIRNSNGPQQQNHKIAHDIHNYKTYNHYRHYDVLFDMVKPVIVVNSAAKPNEPPQKQQIFDYEMQIYQKMLDYKRQHYLVGTNTNLQQNIQDRMRDSQIKVQNNNEFMKKPEDIIKLIGVNSQDDQSSFVKIPELVKVEGQRIQPNQNINVQDKSYFSQNISPKNLPQINITQNLQQFERELIQSERQQLKSDPKNQSQKTIKIKNDQNEDQNENEVIYMEYDVNSQDRLKEHNIYRAGQTYFGVGKHKSFTKDLYNLEPNSPINQVASNTQKKFELSPQELAKYKFSIPGPQNHLLAEFENDGSYQVASKRSMQIRQQSFGMTQNFADFNLAKQNLNILGDQGMSTDKILQAQSSNQKNYHMPRQGGHLVKRSLHSKAFAGILGPGGAGGANFMNQIKKGQLQHLYQSRDLMGFLEIQKMTMPTKDQAQFTNANQMHQVHQLQQQYLNEQNQINGLLASIQNTQQKYKQFQNGSPQQIQQQQINFIGPQTYQLKKHQYQIHQRSMQMSSMEEQAAAANPTYLPMNPNFLKFVVLAGNNSKLIKDAMLRRSHKWIEAVASDPYFHFKWQPVSYGIKFEQVSTQISANMHPCSKQLVNHFEFHSHLTEKSKLFKNLTQYSIKLKENVFDYIPLTYFVEIDIGNPKYYAKAIMPFMNSFYALEDIKKKTIKYYLKIEEMRGDDQNQTTQDAGSEDPYDEQFIFKHFYNNKRLLIKQHLKEEKESKEKTLKKYFFRYTMPFCHFSGHNLWLLKPTKLNRGRGIHVYNNLGMLKSLIHKYCEGFQKSSNAPQKNPQQKAIEPASNEGLSPGTKAESTLIMSRMRSSEPEDVDRLKDQLQLDESQEMDQEEDEIEEQDSPQSPQTKKHDLEPNPNVTNMESYFQLKKTSSNKTANQFKLKHNSFILQKYIERPLLIHQRKFDIRVWVFINYDFSCYIFKEGYLRTSSSEFSIDPNNPDDQYVHLTNNAIQKYSENYGNFEDGNQMSYDQFQEYLDMSNYKLDVKNDLVHRMKQLIVRSIFATKSILDPQKRKSCFELFGYDFIIDEDLNLWLIEVNTNPCIEESSSILKIYLPRMIDDMLKLSVDQFYQDFNPKQNLINSGNQNEIGTIDESLEEQKYFFPVPGYEDEENMWELMCNIKDKKSRQEAKAQFFQPIQINSKYAFQIRDRQFKVKKYTQQEVNKNNSEDQKLSELDNSQ